MTKKIQKNLSNLWSKYGNLILLFLIFVYYLTSRLWMYVKHGQAAFGYDTGIYRHIIIGYFDRLGDTELPAFGFAALSNMLRILGFTVDDIAYDFYILLSILIFFALYFVVKRYFNVRSALFSVFLFSVSVLQFEFYWWYYYRNLIALFFILISFILIHRRSYLLILALSMIAVIHPVSLVPVALALSVYMILDKSYRAFLFINGLVALALVLILNWQELGTYFSMLLDFGAVVTGSPAWRQHELTGQFVSVAFFVSHSFWYIPIAGIGIYSYLKKSMLFVLFLASNICLALMQFLLYRRFFVYIDVMLILSAGVGLSVIVEHIKLPVIRRIILVSFIIVSVMGSSVYIFQKQSLLRETDVLDMQFFSQKIPDNAYLMTISSYYAPWLYGFTSFDIIAPGMFEHNKWNEEEWYTFWYAQNFEERHALLSRYADRPIYIYVGPYFQNFGGRLVDDSRFTHVDTFLWAYNLSDTL